jgi:hydroxymethylbilane synthase
MGAISDAGELTSVRFGTRGSALALQQADACKAMLRQAHPALDVQIVVIQSQGDLAPDRPLASLGAQGIFTAALDARLIDGSIDVAIHSAKDLPSRLPSGLSIAAAPVRADPRDCLVTRDGLTLEQLPAGATVGTGSPRRAAQLLAARPDLRMVPIRGNVDTRRRAALEGRLDGVVLAAAGLLRLDLLDARAAILPTSICLPQAGQGIIAMVTREDDVATSRLVASIDDQSVHNCLDAERSLLAGLAAGCQAPVAGHAIIREDGTLLLQAVVAGGGSMLRDERSGAPGDAARIGHDLAEALLALGAARLLQQVREVQ